MARPKHSADNLEKMKLVQDNLRRISKSKGITQTNIAQKTGLSKSTVSDYFNAVSLISPGNLQLIADALGVDKEEIYFKKEAKFVNLGLYGEIYCGNGEVHYGHAIDVIETPKEWVNGSEHFYLEAKGDSMIGSNIHEGDLLLVRKQSIVENGEIGVVIIGDKRLLKRIYRTDNKFTLVSDNPKYPPLEYFPDSDEDIRIIGKLKKAITSFN